MIRLISPSSIDLLFDWAFFFIWVMSVFSQLFLFSLNVSPNCG